MNLTLVDLVFYGVALVTIASAGYAVFTRNIVRAVFALLATFFGMAVLYGMLSADFVAVIQVLVYVGGILVLLLFAVMLTGNIEDAPRSSRSGGLIIGLLTGVALLTLLIPLMLNAPWLQVESAIYSPTTAAIGEAILKEALLPFEVLSIVLLGIVIGAVVIARFKRSNAAASGQSEEAGQ
ncbi:MAG: NADH-quinone oxidoreductase subunit J [Deltaproteobacteria bacterium]|nr:NADH-quinone oxidoreductase subunit J [Deltaproteobacteria bacterium]